MFSRRFDLVIEGVSLSAAQSLAEPYAKKYGGSRLWIRIRPTHGAHAKISARLATETVHAPGGSYIPNGTLRGRIEQVPAAPDAAVQPVALRITGRMRWGVIAGLVWIMLVTAAAIAGMALFYENEVIGWFVLAPLAVAAMNLVPLVSLRRSDPQLLAERLRAVLRT